MNRALVTGAAGGIGQAVALRLAAKGYGLVLVDKDLAALQELAVRLAGIMEREVRETSAYRQPATVQCIQLDLADRAELGAFCQKLESDVWQINLVLVNAGVLIVGDVHALSYEQLDMQMEVNARSAMHILKACLPGMTKRRQGHLMATVSLGGIISLPGSATYSASKYALRGFLSALREEVRPFNLGVTGLYPGAIDTPMLHYEAREGGSLLNFLGQPKTTEAVAAAVVKALEHRRLEVYIPFSDSIGAKLGGAYPWLLSWLHPLLSWFGERGRLKYLRNKKLDC